MEDSQTIIAAFSEEQTEKLTRVSKSQLHYWDRTKFYSPSFAEENRGLAYSRVYSFRDIVALRVLNVLRNQYGVSLQHLREVSHKLSHLEDQRWIGVKLFVMNKRVHWVEPGAGLPQEILSQQYVLPTVDLDEVVSETRRDIAVTKGKRGSEVVGRIERSRYRMHNAPVIAGTRIPASTIKRFREAGYSLKQIKQEYPDLEIADIKAALEYEESRSAA